MGTVTFPFRTYVVVFTQVGVVLEAHAFPDRYMVPAAFAAGARIAGTVNPATRNRRTIARLRRYRRTRDGAMGDRYSEPEFGAVWVGHAVRGTIY